MILYLFPSTDSRDPQYGQFYAKRIVATRGQSIEFRQKNLFRDGKPVGENYKVNSDPQFLSEGSLASFVVPDGTVYVLGDNRDHSYDSRFIGPIPMVNVKGKVIAKGKLWRMSAI